jgi:hypothetical protein
VRVLDRGITEEDEDYIVYEHVEGGDLGTWLDGRTLPAREAVRLVARIARGVEAAHAALLVHCDLKPGNILMTPAGQPKVADFGIAIRHGEGAEAVRERDDGRPVGNIAFISPEQFRMEAGSLSVASDVYALGGILYFLLTRRFPNGSSAAEIARNHDPVDGRRMAPSILEHASPGADSGLDRICHRALAIEPSGRHRSAGALADDLEAWLTRRPIEWQEPSAMRRAALLCRRRPALAAMTAVAIVAVLAGALGSWYWYGLASAKAADAQEAWKRILQTRDRAARFGEVRGAWTASGFDFDLLPMAIVLEWANGQAVIGDPLDGSERWQWRLDNVRRFLSERQAGPLRHSIETTMWESMYGLWLLNANQHADAEAVLDRNLAELRATLKDDGDPWIGFVERIRAMAIVRRIHAAKGDSAPSPADQAELEAAAAVLEPCLLRPASQVDGGAVQQLVLITLMDLDGPELLNRWEPFSQAYTRASIYVMKNTNPYDPLKKAVERVQEKGYHVPKPRKTSP